MPTVEQHEEKHVIAAVTIASGMAFLAGSAVQIALPAVQEHFGADFSGVQWIVNAYLLALASLIVAAGALGDRFGKKRTFLTGIAVFGLGSLLSGLAPAIGWLIAAQGLTGVGAAMMIPGSLAVINTCIAPERRNRAIGIWAGVSAGIAALGPFVGGVLVEWFGWPAVFYASVPLAAVAFGFAWAYVPSLRSGEKAPLDIPGVLTLIAGLGALSYGLIAGPERGWSTAVVLASLILGAVLLAAFLLIEYRSAHPAVPPSLFKEPLVAGANLTTLFLYFALQGAIFFLVFNMQQVQGYTSTQAGLALLPAVGLITLVSGPAGALADKLGPRPQMIGGPLTVAAGFLWLAFTGTEASFWTGFLPGLILFGLGMGFVIAPLTRSALAVRDEMSGLASGVSNAVSRTAGLLAVAVLGGIMLVSFSGALETELGMTDLPDEIRARILDDAGKLAALTPPEDLSEDGHAAAREAVESSFIAGFRSIMLINAALAALSAAVAAATICRPGRKLSKGRPGDLICRL